jgi:hypothetical protein
MNTALTACFRGPICGRKDESNAVSAKTYTERVTALIYRNLSDRKGSEKRETTALRSNTSICYANNQLHVSACNKSALRMRRKIKLTTVITCKLRSQIVISIQIV